MKKVLIFVVMAFALTTMFAQKRKPVVVLSETISLQSKTNAKGYWGPLYGTKEQVVVGVINNVVRDVKQTESAPDLLYEAQTPAQLPDMLSILHSSLFSELTETGVFKVSTETTEESDYIFEATIDDFTARRAEAIASGKIPRYFAPVNDYDMTVSAKATDAKTGEIVFDKTFHQGQSANPEKLISLSLSPKEMAETVAKTIAIEFANKICPPTVLSVSDGVIEIPIQGVSVGSVVEVVRGYGNTVVAEIIVYELDMDIARCKVDPKGKYVNADIKEGMSIKVTDKNGKKALKNINKAK